MSRSWAEKCIPSQVSTLFFNQSAIAILAADIARGVGARVSHADRIERYAFSRKFLKYRLNVNYIYISVNFANSFREIVVNLPFASARKPFKNQ